MRKRNRIGSLLGLFYLAAYGANASDTTLPALPAVESCNGQLNLQTQKGRMLAFFCSSDELRSKNREAAKHLPSLDEIEGICVEHWDNKVDKDCKDRISMMFQKLAAMEEKEPVPQHPTL